MMRAPAWPGREAILAAAVFTTLVAVAAVWLALDRRPPEWDHANHLERAVTCAGDLARGDLRAVLARSSFYPPLVPCAAGLAYRLAPSDVAAAQTVILAFLALGMGAVYVLARDVAGAPAGVVSALVFGTAPFVVFSALRFQLDLPLASMVALTTRSARPRKAGSIRSTPNECESSGRRSSPPTSARSSASSRASRA